MKDAQRDPLRTLRTAPRAFVRLYRVAPTHFVLSVAARLVGGALPPAMAWVAKLIVDHLVDGGEADARLWGLIAIEAGLALGTQLATQLAEYGNAMVRERSRRILRHELFEHVATLDLAFLEQPENHDLVVKASTEATYRPAMLVFLMVELVGRATTVIGFFGLILSFEPVLALVLAIGVFPALFVAQERSILIHSLHDEETPEGRRAAYMDQLLMSRSSAQELKLFGFARAPLSWVRRYVDASLGRRDAIERRTAFRHAAAAVASVIPQYGAVAWVAYLAATGPLSVGDFTLLVAALAQVRGGLGQTMRILGNAYEHALFLEDLDGVMGQRPQIRAPEEPRMVPQTPDELRFEGVWFSYPGADEPVFRGLDLTLRRGEITALVGHNGAGKTTLVKLMCRLYDPQRGRITVDGIDIRELDPEEYRKRFAVLFQDFVHYELSAYENIALEVTDPESDTDVVTPRAVTVAERAGVQDIVEGLPRGWGTVLGRSFEKSGQDLSQGQWQRIALARALYRDAPILVFDEPTAAVDPEAEAALIERYTELVDGKLSVLITHRFNTVRSADRIVVLSEGEIIEDGGHDDLIAAGKTYARLFEAQAQHYR